MKIGQEDYAKHELGNSLNGGQCQIKIGGAHLHHVGIAIRT